MNSHIEFQGCSDAGRRSAILIAQYFPPLNIIPSHRALRMARVLLERYDRVYVLTLPTDDLTGSLLDPGFGEIERADPRLCIIPVVPWFVSNKGNYLLFTLQRALRTVMARLFCSSGFDWVIPVARTLQRLCSATTIELIISTGGPFVPFPVVGRIAGKLKIPCILDYRDLWSQNPRTPFGRSFRYMVRRTLERYANKRSTIITTVSEGCKRAIVKAHPFAHVRTLLNTPDKIYVKWFFEQSITLFDSQCLNIVLTGTIYRECTCRLLVDSINKLPSVIRSKVRLHYFGGNSNLIRPEFESGDISENLKSYGVVSKSEAVAAVRGADILLSLVFDQNQGLNSDEVFGVMTTKIFDYFLSGKPIINIGPIGADVARLARDIGYSEFHNFYVDQEEKLKDLIGLACDNLVLFRSRKSIANLPDFKYDFDRILTEDIFGANGVRQALQKSS
jgi:hypothetical protein